MVDVEQMVRRQRILADFGEFALRSEDLDSILTTACRLVGEALGTDLAKVLEIEGTGDNSTLFMWAGVGWPEGTVGEVRLPMRKHSSETYAITSHNRRRKKFCNFISKPFCALHPIYPTYHGHAYSPERKFQL